MRRKIAGLLLVCIAALLLFAMQRTTPRYMDLTGPIPVYGRMGEAVAARLFHVQVARVVFARELSFEGFGRKEVRTTSGLWAIVTVRLAARASSTVVSGATWQGPTGLRYRQTDRLSLAPGLAPYLLDPGLPETARFVFEIRPDQVRDATLLVSSEFSPRLDSEARIALDQVPLGPGGAPLAADRLALGKLPGAAP